MPLTILKNKTHTYSLKFYFVIATFSVQNEINYYYEKTSKLPMTCLDMKVFRFHTQTVFNFLAFQIIHIVLETDQKNYILLSDLALIPASHIFVVLSAILGTIGCQLRYLGNPTGKNSLPKTHKTPSGSSSDPKLQFTLL